MNNVVYISLGSNLGDRERFLFYAIKSLDYHTDIVVRNVSSIYETDPVGFKNQEKFLNMVIKIFTSLKPLELLAVTKDIENRSGRKRGIQWGPRTLDLDILLYNQENIKTEQLIVPHPRMKERGFVLIPLVEINSCITIPSVEQSINQLLHGLVDREGVKLWKPKVGEGVYELFENLKDIHKKV